MLVSRPPCWGPSRWAPAWRLHINPFISRILDLNYRTVLIFISIYFEWRDTENQQFYFFYHVSMGNERVYNDQSMEFFSFFSENALSLS